MPEKKGPPGSDKPEGGAPGPDQKSAGPGRAAAEAGVRRWRRAAAGARTGSAEKGKPPAAAAAPSQDKTVPLEETLPSPGAAQPPAAADAGARVPRPSPRPRAPGAAGPGSVRPGPAPSSAASPAPPTGPEQGEAPTQRREGRPAAAGKATGPRRSARGTEIMELRQDASPGRGGDDEATAVVSRREVAGGKRRQERAVGTDDPPSSRRAKRCPACGSLYSGAVAFCPFDGEPVVLEPDWNPSSDGLIGRIIADRYEVRTVLAEGGMGTAYKVRHKALGSHFAMKVLRRDLAREPDVARRLVDEARATAAIGHPNIVAVTDFGEIGAKDLPDLGALRLPYFVMELLTGKSLADVIAEHGALTPKRAADIVRQVAAALAAAHEAGIVHRDLKPDNVQLSRSEVGDEIAKVLDFGVAKTMGASKKTRAGTVFGTPHYMSPEQAQGLKVDHRTDIYSLGVILYECLTGRVPFEADTYMGVMTKHLFARPEPIADIVAAARGIGLLEPVALRCLEKDPGDRFQSMEQLAAAIDKALAEGADTAEEGAIQRAPKLRLRAPGLTEGYISRRLPVIVLERRWPLWIVGAVGLLVAAIFVAAGVRQFGRGEARAPRGDLGPRALPASPSTGHVTPGAAPSAAIASAGAGASAAAAIEPPSASAGSAAPPDTALPAGRGARTAAPAGGPPPGARPRKPKPRGGDIVNPWGD
ncbi:MAG: serine/threonine protein kinase [Deltaproteobacteria bacterium]|nr:serine/threonine protein kinase [Deltaproteobacteria bacterium]